jgi:hypothetical protein
MRIETSDDDVELVSVDAVAPVVLVELLVAPIVLLLLVDGLVGSVVLALEEVELLGEELLAMPALLLWSWLELCELELLGVVELLAMLL